MYTRERNVCGSNRNDEKNLHTIALTLQTLESVVCERRKRGVKYV